jgi:Beta-propeller repeat
MSRRTRVVLTLAASLAVLSSLGGGCGGSTNTGGGFSSTGADTATTGSTGTGTTTSATSTGTGSAGGAGGSGGATSTGTGTGTATTGAGGGTSTTTGTGTATTSATGSSSTGAVCPPGCTGAFDWAKAFGGAGAEQSNAVAADSFGNVFVGGFFNSTMDLGCGPISPGSGDTPFLAKLDPNGNCLWSHGYTVSLPAGTTSQIRGVATDAAGNVYVTGLFFGTLNLGGGVLTSTGQNDLFVAKFDPSGAHVWSENFGDVSVQTARSIAVDGAGHVLVAGDFAGTIKFLPAGQISTSGGLDAFVIAFDNTGQPLWGKAFGDGADQTAQAVAADASGNVLVTGKFGGVVDFGGGPLSTAGLNDVFVVELDKQGNYVWSKRFGTAGDDGGAGIAADPTGNVLVTGYFSDNPISFGGASLPNQGGQDAFLAELDPTGAHLWSHAAGDASTQGALGVAVDSGGNVAFTGYMGGSADFGGGVLSGNGMGSVFVAKYSSAGAHLWSKVTGAGGASLTLPAAVATDPSGAVLVTGQLNTPTDFGGGSIGGFGKQDGFVEKLAP